MAAKRKQSVLFIRNGDAQFETLLSVLKENGYAVDTLGDPAAAHDMLRNARYRAVIADLGLRGIDGSRVLASVRQNSPDTRTIFIARNAQEQQARSLVSGGADGYFVAPFDSRAVASLVNAPSKEAGETRQFPEFCGIVGSSPAIHPLRELICKVADTPSTVLISGESGSGKELVARAVHSESSRANKRFVVVHCSAIPETLLESELFGHERGAFTGAYTAKKGLFQSAHGGTLFLDEIGEVSHATQVKLLRVLESGVVRPVGSVKDSPVDVRVIAATNRDLTELVQNGDFREDLFYRLNVFPIRVPSLRERREDIRLLTEYFLYCIARERGDEPLGVEEDAMQLLMEYSWPGNIRELENVIERAAILGGGGPIAAEHLPREIKHAHDHPSGAGIFELPFKVARNTFERDYVERVLDRCEGNVAQAARTAGMSRAYFYEIIKKYNVRP